MRRTKDTFIQGAAMTDTTFDPKTIFETYRTALAPAIKVQQESVKALDRVGRYQYAVAGDYLEWSLAQAKAAVGTQTPAEFMSKQVELATSLSEKLRARAQELVRLATDSQSGMSEAVNESVNRAAAETKRKVG
jgi:phasin family protein